MTRIKRIPVCLAAALFFLGRFSLQAQDTKPATDTKPAVQLTAAQLKAVEGVYQSAGNKDMYVQFTARENGINAKLLWNGNQLRLLPSSDSSFVNTEEGEDGRPLVITFRKGKEGSVTQVMVGGNGLWNKVNDYKPVVKTEMAHTPEQLKPFEGIYQNHNRTDMFLQLTEKNNKLVLKQHWDNTEVDLVPESELFFYSKDRPQFSVKFAKGPDSSIAQMVAFGRDQWDKAKKVQPATAELHVYEGKYRFKDDPDDLIQVSVKGDNLVIKQLWDGKETIVAPLVDLYFYNSEQSYPVKFRKDNNGAITQALVLGGDVFEKLGN